MIFFLQILTFRNMPLCQSWSDFNCSCVRFLDDFLRNLILLPEVGFLLWLLRYVWQVFGGKCVLREYSIAFHEFAQMLSSGTTSQGSELAELNYPALLLPEEPTPQFNYIPTPWSQVTTCTRRLERSTFEIRLGGSGSLGTGTAD